MRSSRPRPSNPRPAPRSSVRVVRRRRPSLARALLVVLLAATASATTACHHRRAGAPDEEPTGQQLPEFVVLAINNHNWSDVVITLVRPDGTLQRLGTVTAGRSSTLQFPGQYIAGAASLQLIAKPIGGFNQLRSPHFTVQPGQQVVWTIEHTLDQSSLAVY